MIKNDIALSIKNLDFYYGDHHALKAITFDIFSKKITALIGASGCGKSTLLRTFNKMYELYSNQFITGEILFDNTNILEKNINLSILRSRIGMVFQKPTPFNMSIFENIAFGIKLYQKLPLALLREKVESILKQVTLWDEVKDRLYKSALQLSGGQQQRLCIARALAVEPEIILMDEPTSALDPVSTAKVEELFDVLKEKYTIVFVTHNLQQAARCADHVAFFYEGELVEVNDAATLFTKPTHSKTHDYITGRFG
ncbi:Phosphate import ATP-binding protein PstB [Commensalibacter sp. Nvir]|uniref:phosphate ABC transporter ATP-binding protein PstB n=1 Tax=Commensalibacter sp. Nvir TaxID=3069817 RepID=UPI002D459E29|nr:Phosphate import ATP-binding protein PstB [Commensalibacter sp. Nvir]